MTHTSALVANVRIVPPEVAQKTTLPPASQFFLAMGAGIIEYSLCSFLDLYWQPATRVQL